MVSRGRYTEAIARIRSLAKTLTNALPPRHRRKALLLGSDRVFSWGSYYADTLLIGWECRFFPTPRKTFCTGALLRFARRYRRSRVSFICCPPALGVLIIDMCKLELNARFIVMEAGTAGVGASDGLLSACRDLEALPDRDTHNARPGSKEAQAAQRGHRSNSFGQAGQVRTGIGYQTAAIMARAGASRAEKGMGRIAWQIATSANQAAVVI